MNDIWKLEFLKKIYIYFFELMYVSIILPKTGHASSYCMFVFIMCGYSSLYLCNELIFLN